MNKFLSKIIVFFLSVFFICGCASSSPDNSKVVACGVMMEVVINPDSQLTHFKVHEPIVCNDKNIAPTLSPEWKKTACVQFTMQSRPTYRRGEKPKKLFYNFYYRPNRPNVIYPNVNSGQSPEDIVIYVQKSILEPDGTVCSGSLNTAFSENA